MLAVPLRSYSSSTRWPCPPAAAPRGRLADARERCGEREDARRAVALVLIIDALAMPPRRGDRHPGLLEQLDRLFVHAQHGMLRVIRHRIGLEHFLHAGHELGVLLRWDHPILDLALRHPVFLRALRTVSWLIESTTSKATSSSASSCNVQCP